MGRQAIVRRLWVWCCIVGAVGAWLLPATSLAASTTSGDILPANIRGVVPTRDHADSFFVVGGQLTYHGGPTMHTNTAYAIYWSPDGYTFKGSSGFDTNYRPLIDGFFSNVAADSGKTTNVYYSDTQYTDSVNGNILYQSTFGGSVVDTTAFPTNGCAPYSAGGVALGVCLTDAQIQAEVQAVVQRQGWSSGVGSLFFVFTPKGVGSCFSQGGQCAFSVYCAYHSWIGSGPSATLYANMPYADTVPSACDANQHPNNDDADATLNVTSHEHNEAITDAQGSAWYDRRGSENGDKCAWKFGATSGPNGAEYNQDINGAHYYLQMEWSNASRGCVQQGK